MTRTIKIDFVASTVVLDLETGSFIEESTGFKFTKLSGKFVVLFVIDLKDRGRVILDLFQRNGTTNKLA
jgi:hypothetical protein